MSEWISYTPGTLVPIEDANTIVEHYSLYIECPIRQKVVDVSWPEVLKYRVVETVLEDNDKKLKHKKEWIIFKVGDTVPDGEMYINYITHYSNTVCVQKATDIYWPDIYQYKIVNTVFEENEKKLKHQKEWEEFFTELDSSRKNNSVAEDGKYKPSQ